MAQDPTIPVPLTSGATDNPDAQQSGAVAPPPLPQGYQRAGQAPTAPPLPAGYKRPSEAAAKAPHAPTAPKAPAVQKTPPYAGVTTPEKPHQDSVENAIDEDRLVNPAVGGVAKSLYQGAKGLYHGAMGEEQPPTAPVKDAGFTPEHIGETLGSYARQGVGFLKNLGQDVTGIGTDTGKRLPLLVPDQPQSKENEVRQAVTAPTEKSTIKDITDPHAQTLIGKYIMAPSMEERAASEKELEKYYQTHGAESFGHALSAFVHGTLGEYVPMIGPLAGDIMDTGARGDIGGALAKTAALYATDKATEGAKDSIKERVAPYVDKAKEALKSPEVKQAEANVEATAKPRAAAQAKYDAAKAQNDAYSASHAQGVQTPEAVVKQLDKAKAALDEATFHHEAAQEHLQQVQQQNTLPTRAGRAVGKLLPKEEAPATPEAPITAAPAPLKPLGPARANLPQLGEPQAPPTVSPAHATTTIPQEPTARPQVPVSPVQLPGGEPVGKLKQLGEGTPIGPQVPAEGLPKIKQEILPPERTAKAAKPERGKLSDLTVDEKGNVVEKDPQGAHLQRLLEESLKNTKGNENFPAATVESETKEEPNVDRRKDTTPVPEAQEQREGARRAESNDRRQEEVPVENERRTGERRVLRAMNEKAYQESAFGGGDKGLDTDAYAAAMEQARKELGPDASVKDVVKRRDEIVNPEAKGKTGDVGEQARQANPEPTRAETKAAKPVLPKEEPTGYEAKKEEVVPTGEEGREQPTSAAEYHPAVQEQVFHLSNADLDKLAGKYGIDPTAKEYSRGKEMRDQGRHQTGRKKLAEDITNQMDDDEKINIGRLAGDLEHNPDMAGKTKAERAKSLFPKLREEGPAGGSYGSKNKGVTKEGYNKAKSDFMDKASRSNAGADPSMLADLAKVGAYHFEAGLREFGDWSKKMVEELGETVRPHLQKLWADVNEGGKDEEEEKLKAAVSSTSTKDTDHVQAAMKELGPDAKLSDVMKRAQELKDKAAKPDLKQTVSDFNKENGRGEVDTAKHDVDPRRKGIAEAYDAMKHAPENPEVKKSYAALIDDAKKQWEALEKAGIKFEPQDEDPYKSYDEMKKDFEDNNRLRVFRGGNPLPEDHPLAQVDPKTGETYNTMFRAVHDAIGHLHGDNDFTEKGEENAFRTHRQTMSKEAIPAMTTETKGQVAAFFNGGNEFPDQKAGILPERFHEDSPEAKPVLDHIKSGKDFALLTAENPNNERATPEENTKRNAEMKAELEKMGYKPVPIEGHNADVEGEKENSFFVPDIKPEDAAKISKKYNQASVMTKEGIHDLDKDTVHPAGKLVTGEEAAKQPYHSTVAGEPFSIPVDTDKETSKSPFPDEVEHPTTKTPKGAKPLPTGDSLIKKYGEGGTDPRHVTFILDDGRTVGNTGSDHDVMLGGKATDKNPPRERFVQEGNIRVRAHQGTSGRETALSIPENGVNSKQWEIIKKMAPQLSSGAVMVEVGKPGGKYEAIPYGEASPERLEKAIKNVTGQGEAPQSVGAARAGTSLAKEQPLTPEKLQERLPDIAQEHLTEAEKKSVTTTKKGKPNENAVAKFVKNLVSIPSVQEYVDIARAGEGARKWYSRSSAAFDAMKEEAPKYFDQEGDKEKFLGVLAGSSPQQAVVSNLRETLGLWKSWVDAGRPKLDINKWKEFGDKADADWKEDGSPRVGGTKKGASKHWDYAPTGPEWKNEQMLLKNLTLPETKVPNIIKALSGQEMWPDVSKNVAFKAPSFAENLRKWLDGVRRPTSNVTNDSWMGLFGGIDKSALSKPENYHPLSVATRAAAKELGWEPEEAQAAIWSFTQALTEKGTEDPEVVRHYSEDFKDIMEKDNEVRSLLEDLGVNLDDIDKRLAEVEPKPEVTSGGSPTSADSIRKLRERIEDARGKGAIPEPKSIQGSLFKENPAFENRRQVGSGHTRPAPTELELRKQEDQARSEAEKLKAERAKEKELGGTKGPMFKDSGTDFNTSEYDEEEKLKKLGEKKPGLKKLK